MALLSPPIASPVLSNPRGYDWVLKDYMNKLRQPKYPGFTLVEMMIVAAVIALLAAIAIPSIVHARTVSHAFCEKLT